MPETAMRKNDRLISSQHDIRLSGQRRVMKPETKPFCVQALAE
jgi:hypothetical protein